MSQQDKQYMLMFTLGPVQSFISHARKTRDLWIGRFLLSKLMEAAMEGIDDDDFVFPGAKPEDRKIKADIPDLPNKYVALFASVPDAEEAARLSERQIAACWYTICNEVRDRLLKNYYTAEIHQIWERQTSVGQLFEIYWVVVHDPGKDYGFWLEETTRVLDARKRLRDFLPQDEPGEKSTISGEREVLHKEGSSRGAVRAFWRELTAKGPHTVKDIKKDGSERLDAIDSVKRFALFSRHLKPGLDQIGYPSTSSVATARFVEKLLSSTKADEQLERWKQLTEYDDNFSLENPNVLRYLNKKAVEKDKTWILRRDGDLFFQEAFTSRYLKENYRLTMRPEEAQREQNLRLIPIPEPEKFTFQCSESLKKLYRAIGASPTPYYALVQMDGDHMGTILSAVSDADSHKNLSSALSIFARKHVPHIVQVDHPGRLVYAGGDDVLALTPLEGMLNMVEILQQRYREIVKPVAPDKKQADVTASMGIAIAHHFAPLSVVRRAATEAEKLAKNRYGRNAFVVTLLRRSGEQTRVGCRWWYSSLTFPPVKLFRDFYVYFLNNIFSPKSVHVLLDEASILVGLEREAQCSEVRRVLKRQLSERLNSTQEQPLIGETDLHLSKEEKEQLIAEKIANIARNVVALAEAMDQDWKLRPAPYEELHHGNIRASTELREDTTRCGLVETFGWLLVMAFLAREGLEA